MRNNTTFFLKKVLVTGGSGMIGRQLVNLLVNCGAKVTVVAMDDIVNTKMRYKKKIFEILIIV